MNKPLLKRASVLLASVVCSVPMVQADTLFLPTPKGSQIIAAWVPTDVTYTDGGTIDTMNGPWVWEGSTITNIAPSYSNGKATYVFNSNLPSGSVSGSTAIGTGMPGGATTGNLSIAATGYNGAAFNRLSLTLTVNHMDGASPDLRGTDGVLQGSLTIGGITYTNADATFTTNRSFLDSDEVDRYKGVFGNVALVTYEWDLDALGFTGDYSDFVVDWKLGNFASFVFDAQISVNQVPEPSTWALMAGAMVSGIVVLRRRRA